MAKFYEVYRCVGVDEDADPPAVLLGLRARGGLAIAVLRQMRAEFVVAQPHGVVAR